MGVRWRQKWEPDNSGKGWVTTKIAAALAIDAKMQ